MNKSTYKHILPNLLIISILLSCTILSFYITKSLIPNFNYRFNPQRALELLVFQTSAGPRTVGSEAHKVISEWIASELNLNHWHVEIQEGTYNEKPIRNIIGKLNDGEELIIIGAHYDSRLFADKDPDPAKRTTSVPGANDGASGVAVLLELAKVMPRNINKEIWLVFFDAEDNGSITGWDWIMGSRYFVDQLQRVPSAVIIIDMIGDKDLNIHPEGNSNPKLTQQIWDTAQQLGYSQFFPEEKYQILDDHIPFLQKGFSAIDIIDFDYPYWHTAEDTVDKVSGESLQIVGEVLLAWLMK